MRKKNIYLTTLSLLLAWQSQAQTNPEFKGKIGKTVSESTESWPQAPKAPNGAPNVIWILLDDVGYGASSSFGGLVNTPTIDSLANNGLRFTNFHTTAICAPTRASLLTGRNQHAVHMGGFAHQILSAGFPGWDGRIPSTAGTIAEVLKDNGYNTFAVGKYGLTPDEENNSAGPFDHWPTEKGFEHFYGFLGSQTDQYKPDLAEDNAKITPDGRHLSELITDKALFYLQRQQAAAPDKPFFLYYAPGATHAPHQVSKEWSDLYKGKFDEGWDVYRERVFANQKKLGVIPQNAILPERNPNIKAWNTLSAEEKKLYTRFMEVYAGYFTYTDHEIKRLVDYLKASKQLDNTVIVLILGDNGASKEGTLNGDIDRQLFAKPYTEAENIQYNLAKIDDIGLPAGTEANYPLGWAQAANTPFKYWKQDAHSEGGTHNPLIVFYPNGIKEKGGIRNQYSHVSDILPTTLDITGIKAPSEIKGIKQDPITGSSLYESFDNAKAISKHTTQYYYIFGSIGMYKDGWKAAYAFKPSITNGLLNDFSVADKTNNTWQLYNLNEDFNERIDLAKKYPQKLEELKALFDQQAVQYNIYPLVNWDDVTKRIIKAYSQSQQQTETAPKK
ncbi:arylsulfatase [Solitalea sp. MAHUQ-68]|uniref:Arylsulfatase n=1 Tax=Solitalea agri TaxID=2953739 RepID=A0A9X2JGB5_9SPHI|nr:arylsulfatase [Solitalea agri]MCO4294266.1 arylsulfatase [Solitalea agri]